MAQLFVSYRRDGEAAWTRSLVAELERVYGVDAVFMDVDDIDAGDRFPEVIGDRIAASDAVVAVIGPRWLNSADERGGRRIDYPDDWVRLEIETALKRQIPVFPVLVADAVMPKTSELPESLTSLCDLNAVHVGANRFKTDVGRLLGGLAKVCPPGTAGVAIKHQRRGGNTPGGTTTSSGSGFRVGAVAVLLVAVVGVLLALTLLRDGNDSPDPESGGEASSGDAGSSEPLEVDTAGTTSEPPGEPSPASCTIDVDHIGASISTEPEFNSKRIISVPDGAYEALDSRETTFAGKTFLWFLIDVDGRQGWIPDDGIVIVGKSADCP